MKGITTVFCSALMLFSPALLASQQDRELEQLMADYWDYRAEASPILATYAGDTRYNDRLDDLSDSRFKERKNSLKHSIKRLHSLTEKTLSETNQLNYQILDWVLKHELELLYYPWQTVTFNTFGGWHSGLVSVAKNTPFHREKDYRDYLKRLQQIERYAAQNIALMEQGIEQGYVQPCAPMQGYESTISGFITADPQDSVFYTAFKTMPEKYGRETITDLQSRARAVIKNTVMPAYQRYYDFFTQTYQPACREAIGLSALPEGKSLYEYFVRFNTTLDIDSGAVHALGLAEVKRIRGEMEAIIASLSFEGEFKDFLHYLRTDPQFYARDEAEYLAAAATIAKRIDGKLPQFFSHLPRMSYGILPIDKAIAPKTAAAYAQGAAPDGSAAGQMRLNTYKLDSRPLYGLTSLTLHEAMPGHIMQGAIQQEMGTLPAFRRNMGFSAFSEGWALYTERLGVEMGVYATPYDHFGRLGYEMWRACRLVVDSGIHAKGWTRQQGIDFIAANTALSLHNIRSEVDRYITWPGQALSYKYGEIKIRELRARAEQILGRDFDLRAFHTVLLKGGAMPLQVLDRRINQWIEQQRIAIEERLRQEKK